MGLTIEEKKMYFVRGSFNDELEAIVAALETDINAEFSTSYDVDFFAQREVEDGNCVRTWFLSGGGPEGQRFADRVQVDLFTFSNTNNPDTRLRTIFMGGILSRLGFSSKRNAFYKFLNVSDGPASPTIEKYQLSIASAEGWYELPSEEDNTWHDQITLKLTHR